MLLAATLMLEAGDFPADLVARDSTFTVVEEGEEEEETDSAVEARLIHLQSLWEETLEAGTLNTEVVHFRSKSAILPPS